MAWPHILNLGLNDNNKVAFGFSLASLSPIHKFNPPELLEIISRNYSRSSAAKEPLDSCTRWKLTIWSNRRAHMSLYGYLIAFPSFALCVPLLLEVIPAARKCLVFWKNTFSRFSCNKNGFRHRMITRVGALQTFDVAEAFSYLWHVSPTSRKVFRRLWSLAV